MFRSFSFDPAPSPAYSVYEAERAAMHVSPTSRAAEPLQLPSRPFTPPCTMGDLAVQLKQQTLRIDPRRDDCPAGTLTPPSDCASCTESLQQERPTYSRVAASVLRMQRQSSARMQCCSSHVRDVKKLVRMIEEEEQCTISEAISRTSSTSSLSSTMPATSADDEGIDMDYDMPARDFDLLAGMPKWRPSERGDTCIRVTKQVRMRKRSKDTSKVTKRRSS